MDSYPDFKTPISGFGFTNPSENPDLNPNLDALGIEHLWPWISR